MFLAEGDGGQASRARTSSVQPIRFLGQTNTCNLASGSHGAAEQGRKPAACSPLTRCAHTDQPRGDLAPARCCTRLCWPERRPSTRCYLRTSLTKPPALGRRRGSRGGMAFGRLRRGKRWCAGHMFARSPRRCCPNLLGGELLADGRAIQLDVAVLGVDHGLTAGCAPPRRSPTRLLSGARAPAPWLLARTSLLPAYLLALSFTPAGGGGGRRRGGSEGGDGGREEVGVFFSIDACGCGETRGRWTRPKTKA